MSYFVNARTIHQWAQATVSRSALPHVIRRLVYFTLEGNSIEIIDFPAYESVQRPGFDGEVSTQNGNAWVPDGYSVWELSVQSDVVSKANSDYDTRTKDTPVGVRQATTYICLTARHWRDKRKWAEARRSQGEWKDVRAYDADDIEQWVETAPFGFVVWFGRQIGSRPAGVDDIAERWQAISQIASHPLVPNVFLAGRGESQTRLEEWLSGEKAQLRLGCRSPGEVIDFFCAAIAAMREEDREQIESRAVIVSTMEAWMVLRDARPPAILLPEPSIPLSEEEIARAVSNGHHVLIAVEPNPFYRDQSVELERSSEFELRQALEESGFTPVEAEQYARSAGGSLAILKDRLGRFPKQKSDWSHEVSSEVLSACLLLGGWGDEPADQDAFGQLVKRSFAECEVELQLMSGTREPLLLYAAGKWRLISKDHAWFLFQDRVTSTALNTFENLAVNILADDDPRYQLPEDHRLYSNLSGHVPKYSETIKRHVAETLAFLGEFGSKLHAASSTNVKASVDRIVSSVLSPTCSWHRWASMGSVLPWIAEASPRAFLDAVQTDLTKGQSELVALLHEEEDSFFGRCNHAGLLWALETLAWPKSLLPEVATLLLKLAARDVPKSRWSNRPSSTLCEILSYWFPQTTATIEERIQILDLLIQVDRNAAWTILLTLLPVRHGGFATPTHRPYWRSWANEWKEGATIAESNAFIDATAQRVILQAGMDADRWRDIFESIGRFPHRLHEQLLKALDSYCETEISDSDRRVLSEELSKQINRERYFGGSASAVPTETLDHVEQCLDRLKPRSVVLRHAWLFAPWPDRYIDHGGDHSSNEAALDDARRKAIQEIFQDRGFAGIEELLEHVESPALVGNRLAMVTADEYLYEFFPMWLDAEPSKVKFAAGFIWNRFFPDHWEWVDEHLARCESATAKSNLLQSLRFSSAVWERAASAGDDVARHYWNSCQAFNPKLEAADVETAVQCLIEHGRPVSTLDLLSTALHEKRVLAPETLLRPLEALLDLPVEDSQDQFRQLDSHHIQEIIEELQGRSNVDQDRLIRLEWHFIRLLDGHMGHSALTLQKYLSTSPKFFNEVLSCCFRSRDSAVAERSSAEHQNYMAQHAYQLLLDWSLIPGTCEDGSVDEDQLREWCNEARHTAEESGQLEVCDSHIGQLIAKSDSKDDDGKWPCAALRRVAVEIGSDSFKTGMICGILNLRGARWHRQDGDEEGALAAEFREKADRVRMDAPFVARILDSVAECYAGQARDWDERDRWESR